MSFKLVQRNVCLVTVKGVVSDEAGKPIDFSFKLKCKRFNQDVLQEKLKAEETTVEGLMLEVVTGWDGVSDADGQALEFSTDALKRMFNENTGMSNLAYIAYLKEQAAKEKN